MYHLTQIFHQFSSSGQSEIEFHQYGEKEEISEVFKLIDDELSGSDRLLPTAI
jgi:hypothetical protein